MSQPTESFETAAARRKAGRGIASRFTLGLGLVALLFAAPATLLLIDGVRGLSQETAELAWRGMAVETGEMMAQGAKLPDTPLQARLHKGRHGSQVQIAETEVSVGGVKRPARLYRVVAGGEEGAPRQVDLYAPDAELDSGSRLLVLVLLVTGGLVGIVVIFGAVTARRVAVPLREMIDDVLAISRGRFDHRIRTKKAVGEVVLLGRAVERMVIDLVEGQENERKLAQRQREVEVLRELRRNLKPMSVAPPAGFTIEAAVVEAAGAGTGDFVDSLSDGEGRPTLVVGATATRGMPGALLMAMTRAYLRGAVLGGASPAEACDATNTSLNRDLARGLFASAMVARMEPASASVELVSAGHKAPAVRWDAAAGQLRKLQPNGIALGFDKGPIFRKSLETLKLELKPGDALFLFSTAAFEAENPQGKALGESGVYALAKIAVSEGIEKMQMKLGAFLGGQPGSDLAFALIRREGA
ncbi:MAG: SpoIIE family protein phosphatase [Planctomycetes bacterium]|nr:SpoIIE family protein phosphatase [Planctomycetota bacterium]